MEQNAVHSPWTKLSGRLIFAAAFLLPASFGIHAMDATSANNLANAIITQFGRSKGFTSIPNCGNGQLARSFLQNSGMKVHAFDADQANVDATRLLMKQNSLDDGIRAICDKGTFSVMPYADRFADLIIITNLKDADLASISYAEVERALCPGGLGWIGIATSEGAGVTQTSLQTWINAAAKTYSTATISTTQGTWVIITRKELPGVDTWPRAAYDAAGTRSSRDSVASFPWLPQMKLRPSSIGKPDGTVTASGGRMYMAYHEPATKVSADWLRAYSMYNGELLWQRDLSLDGISSVGSNFMTAAPWGVYIQTSSGLLELDGNTGAVVTPQVAPPADRPGTAFNYPGRPIHEGGTGCGPVIASIKLFVMSEFGPSWDRIANKSMMGHLYKGPCATGPAVSNGFWIFPAVNCACAYIGGAHIEAPAGSFQFDRSCASDGSDRLEKGPVYNAVNAVVIPDASDWPTYRNNYSRTGGTTVSVPVTSTAPPLISNYHPARNYVTRAGDRWYDYRADQQPTPPTVVGGYTFFGGSDGYVRCTDNSKGALVWEYQTGGRIYAAPTVAGGCVYVGSSDGWAYCLEAQTGLLVWRFRAAPVDRRFNHFGYLSSTWPVLGGVVVSAGKAYFAGGVQDVYGTHVYCVNALTGALVWQNNNAGTWVSASDRVGFTPVGYWAIVGQKLEASSGGSSPMVAFNLSTGAMDPVPKEATTAEVPSQAPSAGPLYCQTGYMFHWQAWGSDIGVIDATHIYWGGRPLVDDDMKRICNFNHNISCNFHQIDASGTVKYPAIIFWARISATPAWDATDFFMTTHGSMNLIKTSISQVDSKTDTRATASNNVGQLVNDEPEYMDDYGSVPNTSIFPTPTWTKTGVGINAMVLSTSAVVAVYAKGTDDGDGYARNAVTVVPEQTSWYLGAFNRSTNATIWEVALPDVGTGLKGEPVWQGLAIDRNGNIIVMQRNGNVLTYGNNPVPVKVVNNARPITSSRMQSRVQIFDVKGSLISDRQIQNPTLSGALAAKTYALQLRLPKGFYIVKVKTGDLVISRAQLQMR
jgi:outer membrane protein assembly factor BamB